MTDPGNIPAGNPGQRPTTKTDPTVIPGGDPRQQPTNATTKADSTVIPESARDRLFAVITRLIALLLLPAAYLTGRARHTACQWALALRYPAEDLAGLTPPTRAAFTEARAVAFWRDGQLIGLTSGHRDAGTQRTLFAEAVRRSGSVAVARTRVLPPDESNHVKGIALDVRPAQGAAWLERHGARFHLHRTYDNEWWHFEYRPEACGRPLPRLPHPGAKADTAARSG
ncbi:M15 family metallopeptidase [Actinokineospora sp. HUAS TT18]|uniref:M15 family metallopeptidase n=1 Tax=Actinokineospora sp. HUAS TT18 TaxID=3447451 RepID=UPI003F528A64